MCVRGGLVRRPKIFQRSADHYISSGTERWLNERQKKNEGKQLMLKFLQQ